MSSVMPMRLARPSHERRSTSPAPQAVLICARDLVGGWASQSVARIRDSRHLILGIYLIVEHLWGREGAADAMTVRLIVRQPFDASGAAGETQREYSPARSPPGPVSLDEPRR